MKSKKEISEYEAGYKLGLKHATDDSEKMWTEAINVINIHNGKAVEKYQKELKKWAEEYMEEAKKHYGTDKHGISLEDLLGKLNMKSKNRNLNYITDKSKIAEGENYSFVQGYNKAIKEYKLKQHNFKKMKELETKSITFNATHPGGEGELIRLEKGKFFWKGKEIKDTNKIYERFSEWMAMAEKDLKILKR